MLGLVEGCNWGQARADEGRGGRWQGWRGWLRIKAASLRASEEPGQGGYSGHNRADGHGISGFSRHGISGSPGHEGEEDQGALHFGFCAVEPAGQGVQRGALRGVTLRLQRLAGGGGAAV